MRVLFTSTPGWGHLHPMVPLARAFLARGDDVLFATAADVCPRLEREGLPTAAAGAGEREAMAETMRRFPEIADLAPADRPEVLFPAMFGSVRAGPMLADLLPVAEAYGPDLVVHDAAELAAPVVAATLDVANVNHAFGALLPPARVAAAGEVVAPLWIAQGHEPRPFAGVYESLYLDIYPPSLQPAERPHVPATQSLRPGVFATRGDEPLPAWATERSPDPLVYVTLGTVFSSHEILATVVEAIRDLAVRVVVTVGPKGDPAALGEQPANVHVARYIPQDELLGHCAAVVSHAGSGTFLAALAAGLPQLCLPQAADQFLNAAACAASGTGLALHPGAVTPDAVRVALDRLLSDGSFRAAAERLSGEIAAMPSPDEVAGLLHAYA